jgi:2,4-dienoyl-CoA reductase-like NADH-dependent reductase (Old Yellow Enzyme family)
MASDKHLAHYGQYALGGSELIITEAVVVEGGGRISARDLGLWSDEQIGPLRRIVNFAHDQDSGIGGQLGLKGLMRLP